MPVHQALVEFSSKRQVQKCIWKFDPLQSLIEEVAQDQGLQVLWKSYTFQAAIEGLSGFDQRAKFFCFWRGGYQKRVKPENQNYSNAKVQNRIQR